MLIISRKVNEDIVILENIKIKIVQIKNGRVKLAIDAPKSISINRGELLEKVKDFNIKSINFPLPNQLELKSLINSKVK